MSCRVAVEGSEGAAEGSSENVEGCREAVDGSGGAVEGSSQELLRALEEL